MNWVVKWVTTDHKNHPTRRGINWTNRTLGAKRKKRVQMESETELKMDNLVQSIGKLVRGTQKLAREAAQQYSAEVEAILKAQSRDSRRIERCLDGMLDFCFDDGVLVLYRKLCRYYFDIDAEATVSYVHVYREMWEERGAEKNRTTKGTKNTKEKCF